MTSNPVSSLDLSSSVNDTGTTRFIPITDIGLYSALAQQTKIQEQCIEHANNALKQFEPVESNVINLPSQVKGYDQASKADNLSTHEDSDKVVAESVTSCELTEDSKPTLSVEPSDFSNQSEASQPNHTTNGVNESQQSPSDPAQALLAKRKKRSQEKNWSKKAERISFSLKQKSHGYAWMHNQAARFYGVLNTLVGLPTLVLSTLLSTNVITTFSLDVTNTPLWMGITASCITVAVTVLSAVQTFFNFSNHRSNHLGAKKGFHMLARKIHNELVKSRDKRHECYGFLEMLGNEYDQLLEFDSSIPGFIERRYRSSMMALSKDEHHNHQSDYGADNGYESLPRVHRQNSVARVLSLFRLSFCSTKVRRHVKRWFRAVFCCQTSNHEELDVDHLPLYEPMPVEYTRQTGRPLVEVCDLPWIGDQQRRSKSIAISLPDISIPIAMTANPADSSTEDSKNSNINPSSPLKQTLTSAPSQTIYSPSQMIMQSQRIKKRNKSRESLAVERDETFRFVDSVRALFKEQHGAPL